MTEQRESEKQGGFPRRDDQGRIRTLADLLGVCLAGLVIGVLALVVFELAFASFGAGDFGNTNGWLAVILPAWLFWDDFRAWEFGAARVVAALVAAAVGVVSGLLIAGLGSGLPPLLSGALAAAAFTVAYAAVWFTGVRWLARRTG
ncbi:hypothetical protein ACWD6L_21440 [Micromonospora profundi]|uniref:Uncharacterized protein n=1 Tax=Micromonospora profundi TaxID=1420889 RepID=A0AAJ6L3U6_9ACTN|nr:MULTISPECIES: hypothetical protein [Micromonospora]KOX14938.1 hypothetical protein ADK66_02635 [Micromonospora sp. NRRL B-16802]NJC15187.1 hypothetical protein [Micromonospora profundi]WLS46706.1 hypothetical protein Q3V37_05400 [Micromonospora profundi]